MRHARFWLALLVAAILGAPLLLASSAQAHTTLLSTTPADGAVVNALPTEVTASFDSPLLDVGAAFVVRAADGTIVSAAAPTIAETTLTVQIVSDGPPGEYTAALRVVSVDGHTVTEAFRFTVETGPTAGSSASGAPSAPATPSLGAPDSPAAGGGSVWLLGAVVALGAAGVVLVLLLTRGRR